MKNTQEEKQKVKEPEEENVKHKKGLIQGIKDFFVQHKTLAEILRFLIIGGIATTIDFIVMGVVLYLFEPSSYSNFFSVFTSSFEPSFVATIVGTGVGFIAGLLFNYILSITFVYINKGNSKSALGFTMFTLLSLVGLAIHLLGMYIGFDLLHINEWVVKIFLTIVVLIYNYVSKRLVIFKEKKDERKD